MDISKICIVPAAALLLAGCGSGDSGFGLFDDPGEFTAATRVEASEAETPFVISTTAPPSESSVPDALPDDPGPVNEYGLHDQYFRDSLTNQFNETISGLNFTAEISYYEEDGGKWYFILNERNEVDGRERHIQRKEDPESNVYETELFYLEDSSGHCSAYSLDWDNTSYSLVTDIDADAEATILSNAAASTLFYGIDDLETAVYMGYYTDPDKGTTLEQFMIDDVVYSFTYDAAGILRDSRGGGKRAKIKSFESTCPPITLPQGFKFV